MACDPLFHLRIKRFGGGDIDGPAGICACARLGAPAFPDLAPPVISTIGIELSILTRTNHQSPSKDKAEFFSERLALRRNSCASKRT